MGRLARDVWEFIIGAWGALTLAAVSFVDLAQALKDLGVDLGWQLTISPDARRALFLTLAFLWMFIWFTRVRRRYEVVTFQPEANWPLHLACRWIIRDSHWAASLDPKDDGQWVNALAQEFMSKVAMGRVELFGEKRRRGGGRYPRNHLTPAFKEQAELDFSKLATSEPPTHMWSHNGDVYYDIMLDRAQVVKVWRRKNWLARLSSRSPIERLGGKDYGGIFPQQDRYAPRATDDSTAMLVLD